MKKLLAAALALVLVLLAVEVGTASAHDVSWQFVAAVRGSDPGIWRRLHYSRILQGAPHFRCFLLRHEGRGLGAG